LILLAICTFVSPTQVRALGQIRYQNPTEFALGLQGAASPFVLDAATGGGGAPRLLVEAGERLLFGISGLRTSHLRIGVRHGELGWVFSSTFLSSPIGREYHVSLEPFFRRGALAFVVDVNLYSLSIESFASAYLATIGAQARVKLNGSVDLGYAVENVRLHGEEFPGADTAVYLIASARPIVTGVLQIRMTRQGAVGMSIGSRVLVGRLLAIAVGYEGTAALLKAGMQARFQFVALNIGASLHPVLGVSKSVFVTWRR
jgi:hypothetical protein